MGEQGTGKTTAVRRATSVWFQHISKRFYPYEMKAKHVFDDLHREFDFVPYWNRIKEILTELPRDQVLHQYVDTNNERAEANC